MIFAVVTPALEKHEFKRSRGTKYFSIHLFDFAVYK